MTMRAGLSALLLFALSGLADAQPAPPEAAPAAATAPARPRARRRRRPRYKNLSRPGSRAPRERLGSPGWRPDVKQALETLIATQGNKSKRYNIDWPPVAVFTLEDVAEAHHAGEVAFLRLVERAEFRFSDAWWQRIPIEVRDRARRAHKRFSPRPEAVWPHDEDYQHWRKLMFEAYDLLCSRDGRRSCKSWLTSLLMGYTESEAEAYMRETLEEAWRDPFVADQIRDHAGDEQPEPAARGIRSVPAMKELIEELLNAGFDVWVLSSSNQWITEAMAARYGVDPSRVIGLRPRVLNKRLQTEIVDPVPIGPGTAEAVILFIGRHPELVVAVPQDVELLEYGKGLRVAMDRGDERFKARAAHRGWLLQPELPHAEAEAQ